MAQLAGFSYERLQRFGKEAAEKQKRKEQLCAPFLVNLIPLAKATWPRFAFRALLKALGVFHSMDAWKGHKQPPKPKVVEEEPDVIRYADAG